MSANMTSESSTELNACNTCDYMTSRNPSGNRTTLTLYAGSGGAFSCTYVRKPCHLKNPFGLDLDYECLEGTP